MRAARPPDTSRLRFPIDAADTLPRLIRIQISADKVDSEFDEALRKLVRDGLPKTPAERNSPTKSLRVDVRFANNRESIVLYASDLKFDARNKVRSMLVETSDPVQGHLYRGRLNVNGAVEAVRQSLDACRVSRYEKNDVVLKYVEHDRTYYDDQK